MLKFIKEGKASGDISILMNITERTVKFHVANIMRKLEASNRTHAVVLAIEKKLIETDQEA